MKFKSILTVLVLSITFFSCDKENQLELENVENLELLSNKITLKSSTDKTSQFFNNLGVIKIDIKKKGNETLVKVNSGKTFYFNGKSINLSNYSVKVNKKKVSLVEDDKYKIALKNNKAYLITPDYEGFYENADLKTLQNKKTFILLSFFNELTYTSIKVSINSGDLDANYAEAPASCGFWSTYYSVGVGLTSQAAQANLQYSMNGDIANGDTEGCRKIGVPEAAPFTGGTVWLQAWCCDGYTDIS